MTSTATSRPPPAQQIQHARWYSYLMLSLMALLAASLWAAAWLRPVTQHGQYGPQAFEHADGQRELGNNVGSIRGFAGAGIFDQALRLSVDKHVDTIAVLELPDLDPKRTIQAFDVQFDLLLSSQHRQPTGGLTMILSGPQAKPGGGRQGFTDTGLSIRFDTRQGGSYKSSIDVFVDGRLRASAMRDLRTRHRRPRHVAIHWDANGLDLVFEGDQIFLDRVIPFRSRVGHRFGFSGFSGQTGAEAGLDNLSIETEQQEYRHDIGVVLSEIMPRPITGLRDENLKLVDWIELHNASEETIDLIGHQLHLQRAQTTTVWRFPELKIAPFDYALVFATGKDHHQQAVIHTNFRLPREGASLVLTDPAGVELSRFEYHQASPGVAFGWTRYDAPPGFLAHPTPGEPNRGRPARRAEAPAATISHPGGMLTEPVNITISAKKSPPGSLIRFTIDGQQPTAESTIYRQSITIAHTTTIRAAVFAEDYLPGPIAQSAFLFLDPEVAAFHSNMPILIADSAGVHVDANFSPFDQRDYRPVFSALFEPDQTDARARPLSTPSFASFGAMRVRGHSSALQYPKKQYAWEVRDDRGQDRDVSLLGLPADSDWVLAAPYSDKSLMRNVLAYMAGQVCFGAGGSSQTRYIELFFNQDGDDVTMADYQGIYVLTEKIKRGTGRIDIAGLNETITDPAQITGGYIFKFDKGTDWDQRIRTGVHQLRAALVEPNRLNAVQSRYLTEYLTNFERSLNSSLRADPAKGYRAFIDPDSFLLMNWMVEIFYELDGWWLSSYFTKDRGGKIRAMPLWDYNLAMGNSNQVAGYDAKGWYRDAKVVTSHPWFKRLLADPAMEQRHWELYEKLRKNEFSNERITTYISDLAIYLEEAARRNFKRWPILGESVWPEPRGTRDRTTYRSEVEFLHKWLIRRLEWIDSQFVPTAKLQRVGDHLQISLGQGRSGQIFYTTDGTDPGWRRNPDHSLLLDGSAAPCTVLIPTESNGGDKLRTPDWTEVAPPPNIANWTRAKRASIGFEREPSVFDPFLEHRVDSMYGKSTTCYIRIPFEINTPDAITKLDELCLRMRCDDGFVAYLNGQKIAEKNAPAKLDWQATATRTVSERRAVEWIRFDLEEARGTLRSGKNMLAIHGLNERLKSSDALWSAQLAYVDPANRRPAANARPYRAPIPLTEVHEVRVAVFNGRSWSRTTNWKK